MTTHIMALLLLLALSLAWLVFSFNTIINDNTNFTSATQNRFRKCNFKFYIKYIFAKDLCNTSTFNVS